MLSIIWGNVGGRQKTLTNGGLLRTLAVKTGKAEFPIVQRLSGGVGQQNATRPTRPALSVEPVANIGIAAMLATGQP
jgi:hypothetical protein